ncbi:MAG: hypothetical protein JO261_06060 [Alphaproteobacteria bacterium]|nr:hypothetical protein [Alphaproteobacteria bacterium]MBV9693247.1 hypothetical protein [Alphaproteobacteria bacterium]
MVVSHTEIRLLRFCANVLVLTGFVAMAANSWLGLSFLSKAQTHLLAVAISFGLGVAILLSLIERSIKPLSEKPVRVMRQEAVNGRRLIIAGFGLILTPLLLVALGLVGAKHSLALGINPVVVWILVAAMMSGLVCLLVAIFAAAWSDKR